jgi:hypothetical protein
MPIIANNVIVNGNYVDLTEKAKPSSSLPSEIIDKRKRKIEHKTSSYMRDITTIQK